MIITPLFITLFAISSLIFMVLSFFLKDNKIYQGVTFFFNIITMFIIFRLNSFFDYSIFLQYIMTVGHK